jgi:hypothetical protein
MCRMTRVSLWLTGWAAATLLLMNQAGQANQCPAGGGQPTPPSNQNGAVGAAVGCHPNQDSGDQDKPTEIVPCNLSIRSVRVPIFQNATFRRGLEFQLTEAVIEEIQSKTPYKVRQSAEEADTELIGKIVTDIKAVTITNFDNRGETHDAGMTLTVALVWRDLLQGRMGERSFVLQAKASFRPELGESRATAEQGLVHQMAVQIVSCMLQLYRPDSSGAPESNDGPFEPRFAEDPCLSEVPVLVGELIKVMDEAESPGALVVTLVPLASMGKKAQAAIPAIIRNAERLKLLDFKKASKGSKDDYAETILKVIEVIQADAYPAKSADQPENEPGQTLPTGRYLQHPPVYHSTAQDSDDKNERMDILLNQSEDLRQMNGEWRRFWMNDQPSHMTYARVNGGIDPNQESEPNQNPPPPPPYPRPQPPEEMRQLNEAYPGWVRMNIDMHANPPPAAAANGARWSVWGKLQKTAYNKDGLPVFKVVDERGLPKEYAIAAVGLTLEPYVGQVVSVYGVPTYLTSDEVLRNTLFVVSHLALPPNQPQTSALPSHPLPQPPPLPLPTQIDAREANRCGQVASKAAPAVKVNVLRELINLLNDTESPQTFLATLEVLVPMGKKAHTAIPAILRNAERLHLLEMPATADKVLQAAKALQAAASPAKSDAPPELDTYTGGSG